MALRDRVKNRFERFATATVATLATHPPTEPENVATVAEVAVATSDDRNTRVNVPTPCRDCKRLEVIEIMNELVPGCLYQAEGEFPEGWRRIPAGTARCIWTPAEKVGGHREAKRTFTKRPLRG